VTGFDALLGGRYGRLMGGRRPLPLFGASWRGPADEGDELLLGSCAGPTLDVGCGPGRLTAALTARNVPALGIDSSALAVRLTRARGAPAVCRSVYDDVPGRGHWQTILLADGNIGIGGDPTSLLARCAELLTANGRILVDLDPQATGVDRWTATVEVDGRRGAPFPWATIGPDAIRQLAEHAGVQVHRRWFGNGRTIAELRPQRN
jgi:SAM-dependent methyltransferase